MRNKTRELTRELAALDRAVYAAVAGTPSPLLDASLRRLSAAANYSRISAVISAGLAGLGGRSGRKAAFRGMTSIAATSAVLNLAVKPFVRRERPDRAGSEVPDARHVRMPESYSFPSGHSASAFAFWIGVADEKRLAATPLLLLAGAVAYSRVHTGVHYPGDVIAGSLAGTIIAVGVNFCLDRALPEGC